MKRKAAVRYLLHSYRNPLLIFYGIILLVSLLVCAGTPIWCIISDTTTSKFPCTSLETLRMFS